MFRRLNRRGQSTLEYGVLVAVIVAALLAMQTYFKRGLQGRIRQSSDDVGEQFSPELTTGTRTVTSSVNSNEQTVGGDRPTSKTDSTQSQNKAVDERTGALSEETWR
ncbi:MAG: hypothetical protein ABIG46_00680 [Candidatus Omnitrophota bacterium]|nr:hypothetical protein [Candidatus Omnitrophota bacterium]